MNLTIVLSQVLQTEIFWFVLNIAIDTFKKVRMGWERGEKREEKLRTHEIVVHCHANTIFNERVFFKKMS